MQLSKVLLVLGATSVSLIPLAGRTADKAPVAPLVAPAPSSPDAVEKARAAMHQKMDELQASPESVDKARAALHQKMDELQSGAPAAPAEAPTKAKAKTKAKAAPAPTVPAVTPAPAQAAAAPSPFASPAAPAPTTAVVPVSDPASIDKAREALRQKMTELNGQPDQKATAAKAAAPAKTEKASKVIPADKSKTSQVALTKEQPSNAQPKAPKAPKATKDTKKPASTPAPAAKPVMAKNSLSFEPLSGPASPLSEAKQQRLSELLSKYKADQITPEQYHQERAKILAEP